MLKIKKIWKIVHHNQDNQDNYYYFLALILILRLLAQLPISFR